MHIRMAMAGALLTGVLAPVVFAADGAATAPASTAAATPAAAINLHRPYKPGEVYDVHYVFEENSVITYAVPGKTMDPTTLTGLVDLTGRISSVTSDAHGDCKKFTLSISHLLSKGYDSIRPGTVLTVTFGDEGWAYVDSSKAAVPDNAKPLLNHVFMPYYFSGIKMNNAFGSQQPREVGVEWKPDPAALADFLSDGKTATLLPVSCKGTAKLSSVADTAAHDMRRLNAAIECKDIGPPNAGKVVLIESSGGTYKLTALIPADASTPLPEQEWVFDSVCNYTTPTSRAKAHQTYRRSLKTYVTVVKPAAAHATTAAAGQ